ncbi:complement factor H-related protein 5-like [Mercenaria mercenaria]|uniref:complement factor H-related protein 5-like n=1 Tax=Mercenaria mercenaria TaxID=6596 RepID=UPI00234F2C81|nr:complement factor H-related protein 5-like [Mercenaria mercenaria]XP_053394232.1 complement factor H-related protein 5-like [Mercenaria mercenaria]
MKRGVLPLFFLLLDQADFSQHTKNNFDNEIFYCHGDYCNTYGQIEFCSEVFKKCRPCTDVLDDCFTSQLPTNCTSTCKQHQLEQVTKLAKEKPCPILAEINHGEHNGSLLDAQKPGEIIQFTCKPGYRLKGSRRLECKEYGIWSKDIPTCEEVVCPVLSNVANGEHNGSSYSLIPGDVVVTSCAYGHQLYGDSTTVCNSNGFWTHPLPLCELIMCPRPHPIRNGIWPSFPTKRYEPGITLNAQCEQDYFMDGSALWNCSNEGYWTSKGRFWPVCFPPGESSKQDCTTYNATTITLGVLLLVSISINVILVILYFKQRPRGACQNHHKQELPEMGNVNKWKGMDVSEGETEKLIDKNDEINEVQKVVSLDKSRKAKGKVVPMDTNNIPEPNTVNSHSKEPSYPPSSKGPSYPPSSRDTSQLPSSKEPSHPPSSKELSQPPSSKDTSQEPPAHVTVVNVYNTNENTNQNTVINRTSDDVINQQTTPKTISADDVTHNNPESTPPNTKEDDKAPIEESVITFQPTQPESSDGIPASQSEFGGRQPTQPESSGNAHAIYSRSPTRDDAPETTALCVQQKVNNEQDIGQKVVLPNNEINTDDINV